MTALAATATPATFDVETVRKDFPILSTEVHGKPLCFLDSGASAQKPSQVIDKIRWHYENQYANVHRGAYALSENTTADYEAAREKVRAYLNAGSEREIVFTGSTTAAINLVAYTYGRAFLKAGDEVVISDMEHHSNIVPWQLLRDMNDTVLTVAPISDDGEFLVDEFAKLLTDRTKLVAVTHVSNVLGSVTPLKKIIELAHDAGAKVLVDGSQAVMHMPVDVRDLDVDFYVFTGHKLYGPTGIGVLYAKEKLLDAMPPFFGGGDMISTVEYAGSTWADLPAKFEAGTPPIVQAIGLGAAIDYVTGLGLEAIGAHEADLLQYATQQLSSIDGLRIIGQAAHKTSVISFVMGEAHPHDIATIVDREGVCVRAGHHCAEPLMHRMGVMGTTRASFGLYNKRAEVDTLVRALEKVNSIFG